jgi:hypothetical protein
MYNFLLWFGCSNKICVNWRKSESLKKLIVYSSQLNALQFLVVTMNYELKNY